METKKTFTELEKKPSTITIDRSVTIDQLSYFPRGNDCYTYLIVLNTSTGKLIQLET